jgi:beta-galactosidase
MARSTAGFSFVAGFCFALTIFGVVPTRAAERVTVDLSGLGWRLWHDEAAAWKDDALFFPAPPLDQLPVNPPTGGWDALAARAATPVSVPGTVEEYLQKIPGPDGDLTGVSWWTRSFEIPASATPRRLLLRFESVRERAEVFVNRRLVAYDIVGSTPFEADITAFVRPGERCELALRVTDPGGNFDWRDSRPMPWGRSQLPLSHGFGGVTGKVRLIVCDPVYVEDLAVQNTPAITEANALITIRNTTAAPLSRAVEIRVVDRRDSTSEVFRDTIETVALPPGDTTITAKISAAAARRWEIDNPELYRCEVKLREGAAPGDTDQRTFGFRWFTADNIGTDAIFRLNGKRIVLRSAISWGFWPINGIFPTEELAEKQIRTAKSYGLNMLNFHRAIGNPVVFEKADELGLLYFEEPGAYKSVTQDPLGLRAVREKLLRMVRRDRSHPSLVIYNLINEWDSRNPNPDPKEIARHRADMAAAHVIDPSRFILHTSAWARGPDIDDPAKLHFRPFDSDPHWNGWYDNHHAGGPAVWNESLYRSPSDYLLRNDNVREIVFWGEEGAISTPPRIEKINEALNAAPRPGWDGGAYREWFNAFEQFVTRKNLRAAFPTVDAFTAAMGNVSLVHQGRRIENVRMGNVADGYAINGWESEVIENHSGVVDCFRNPKGDPAILAYYNQPVYVAVKARTTVVDGGSTIAFDCFAINERDHRGPHQLRVALHDAAGRELGAVERTVSLTGGDVFGELLAEDLRLPIGAADLGALQLDATLTKAGEIIARGHDQVWAVDWKSSPISGQGAVWESEGLVQNFLSAQKSRSIPAFADALERLDWIAVARGPKQGEAVRVPAGNLRQRDKTAGVQTTFFANQAFSEMVHQRSDAEVSLAVDDGAAPAAALPVMTNYGVRWTGSIVPPRNGTYTFVVRSTGAVRLEVAGKVVLETTGNRPLPVSRGTIEIAASAPMPFSLELKQGRGAARCTLEWIVPETTEATAANILERVRRDGTTLVLLQQAETWMPLIAAAPEAPIRFNGSFAVGKTWLGGIHFVREHPLFSGLPVNAAMDWPYQSVVRNGDERLGLLLEGEELAAGCYHSYPLQLGTAVGVIPYGRGKIIFSTLDICANLDSTEGPAHVARKLLCNFLAYAGAPSAQTSKVSTVNSKP